MDYQDDLHETFKMIRKGSRRKELTKKFFALLRRIAVEVAIGVATGAAVWFVVDALSKK